MIAHVLDQKIYIALEDGMNVKRYSQAELYEKLSSMSDIERVNVIKKVNASYGYEAVNYKLLQQIYEQEPSEKVVKQEDTQMVEFAKDYMKAYMKMLSA